MKALPQGVTLRPAGERDLPFLLELRRQTMTAHLEASGVAATDEERLKRVMKRFDCACILAQRDCDIGLLKLARDGQAWTLHQIQLLPALQGTGLGSALLHAVIAEARVAGATLDLSVLRANPAKRLYDRLGFQVVAENAVAYEMRLDPAA